MLKLSPENLQPQQDSKSFQDRITSKINALPPMVADVNDPNGNSIYLAKSRKAIESYRHQNDLSKPEVLVQFYFSLLQLPAELLPKMVAVFSHEVVDRLKAQAQVSFDYQSGVVRLAGFPITTIPEQHRSSLNLLLSSANNSIDLETLCEGFNFSTKQSVSHQMEVLKVYLDQVNVAPNVEDSEPLYPLQLVGYPVEEVDSRGNKVQNVWRYSLRSDFVIPQKKGDSAEQVNLPELSNAAIVSEYLFTSGGVDTYKIPELVGLFLRINDSPAQKTEVGKLGLSKLIERLKGAAEISVNNEMGTLQLEGKAVAQLDETQRKLLSVLISAPANEPVQVKEIAKQLGEDWSVTWERLGPLEEIFRAVSTRLFDDENALLSLNIGHHPLKVANQRDPAIPTIFLTSRFKIARTQ